MSANQLLQLITDREAQRREGQETAATRSRPTPWTRIGEPHSTAVCLCDRPRHRQETRSMEFIGYHRRSRRWPGRLASGCVRGDAPLGAAAERLGGLAVSIAAFLFAATPT